MKKYPFCKFALMVLSFSLASMTALAETPLSMKPRSEPFEIQQRAVGYFQDQLDFTTTPYGVKIALEIHDPRVILLDVRRASDYQKGHIPRVLNLPVADYPSFETRKEVIRGLAPEKIYYVYCYHDLCNLSRQLCHDLAVLGYRAKEVRGGFQGWKDQGYPVEKGSKECPSENKV